MIVGPSGSGKSLLFKNLIAGPYKKIFDEVYLFCPTFETDETLKDMVIEIDSDMEVDEQIEAINTSPIDPAKVFTTSKVDELEEIITEIKNHCEKEKKSDPFFRALIVIDDLSIEFGHSKFLEAFTTKCRKQSLSLFLMANKYTAFGPTIRNQVTQLSIYNPGTSRERSQISKDVAGIDEDKMLTMMETVFKQANAFLFINKVNKTSMRNFDEVLD